MNVNEQLSCYERWPFVDLCVYTYCSQPSAPVLIDPNKDQRDTNCCKDPRDAIGQETSGLDWLIYLFFIIFNVFRLIWGTFQMFQLCRLDYDYKVLNISVL